MRNSLVAIALMWAFDAHAQNPSDEDGATPNSAAASSDMASDTAGASGSTHDNAAAVGEVEASEPAALSDLELWGFDLQLDTVVVAASKTSERVSRAAAVVTVVTGEEMRARGYRSVADVMRRVPGFYDVFDLVTHNVGVRGVNGGARASGSIVKLMIDGQPVDFRPSTGNFFGEELVPIEAIERVEVIRGPASALYGADAFLGVVNVVTKAPADIAGGRFTLRGLMVRDHPGGGAGLMFADDGPRLSVLIAASGLYANRDGLRIDAQSPALRDPALRATLSGRSQRDFTQPLTLLAKVALKDLLGGKLELESSIQRLDARAEFYEFGALTHVNRNALLNQNHRLMFTRSIADRVTLTVSGYFLHATATPDNRQSIGPRDFLLIRRVGAQGGGGQAEARIALLEGLSLTLGTDARGEDHVLQSYDQILINDILTPSGDILRSRGTISPADRSVRRRTLYNVAGYAQSVYDASWFSLTGGIRFDYHNLYGLNVSGRAGFVVELGALFTLKLLYGSSFKPPTAEQLFTGAAATGDILGNLTVKSQMAHNFEVALVTRLPAELGEASLNLFATDIIGRVAYIQRALFRSAQNILDEWLVGGEIESRLKLARPVMLNLSGSIARTVARQKSAFLAVLPPVTNELYPLLQVHAMLDVAIPFADLKISAEASVIGPRASSQENALKRGAAYELPTYVYTALSLSTVQQFMKGAPTSIALRVENPLNLRWYEPGFGGIDIPNLGMNATLTISQSF